MRKQKNMNRKMIPTAAYAVSSSTTTLLWIILELFGAHQLLPEKISKFSVTTYMRKTAKLTLQISANSFESETLDCFDKKLAEQL